MTQETAGNGSYSFTNLRPGNYTLSETLPTGYLIGKTTAGSPGGVVSSDEISSIALSEGENGTENDFAALSPSSLTGNVYEDVNDDGVEQSNESGIADVSVTLTGTDDKGNPVNLSATTNSSGSYGFANLRPGNYTITESAPAGYLDGKVPSGSLGGVTGTHQLSEIAIGVGEDANAYNFAELRPSNLSGVVYNDANDSGVISVGDSRLTGVMVTLTGTNDLGQTVSTSTVTDANGSYSFGNLRPGTYALTASIPVGYLQGDSTVGTTGGTAGAGTITEILTPEGTTGSGNDFADLLPSRLSGIVYLDANNDSISRVR